MDIKHRLKKYPFSRRGRRVSKGQPTRREIIRASLRFDMPILPTDLQHLKGNADDLLWLKSHIEKEFWDKIEKLL